MKKIVIISLSILGYGYIAQSGEKRPREVCDDKKGIQLTPILRPVTPVSLLPFVSIKISSPVVSAPKPGVADYECFYKSFPGVDGSLWISSGFESCKIEESIGRLLVENIDRTQVRILREFRFYDGTRIDVASGIVRQDSVFDDFFEINFPEKNYKVVKRPMHHKDIDGLYRLA